MRRQRRVSGRPAPATRAAPLIRGRVPCGRAAVRPCGGGRAAVAAAAAAVAVAVAAAERWSRAWWAAAHRVARSLRAVSRPGRARRRRLEIASRLTWRHLAVWGTARVSPVRFKGPEGPRHA